jgi:hypothetical protein
MLLGDLFVPFYVSPRASTQRPSLPLVEAGGSGMKVWMRPLAARRCHGWCPRLGLLDAGGAALGGGDNIIFAASGDREFWHASSAVRAAGLQRADGVAC